MKTLFSYLKKTQYLFIGLWIVYSFQGIAYPVSSIISQISLLIILLLSLYYAIKVVNRPFCFSNNYIRVLTLLVVLFSIYGIFSILNGEPHYIQAKGMLISNSDYIKNILTSLLPIYAFYFFSVYNLYEKKILQKLIYVFVCIAILQFYRVQRETVILIYNSVGTSVEEITNNGSYILLSVIPLLSLFQRKIVTLFVGLFICMFFVISGFKRGAIIVGLLISGILIYGSLRNVPLKYKKIAVFFSLGLSMAIVFYFQYLMDSSEYFASRISATKDGDSSGRGDAYVFFINYYFSQLSSINMIFGNGADSTLDISDNYAHNDWLEILINQGIVGILAYISYFSFMIRQALKRSNTYDIKIALLVIFVYAFSISIFSMSYSGYRFYCSLAIGYFVAQSHLLNNNYDVKE